jgi:hypothetical protein
MIQNEGAITRWLESISEGNRAVMRKTGGHAGLES